MAINLLALEPHKVSRDLSGYITYIYGAAKVGKTTLGSEMPKPLLIACEKGYNAIGGIIAQDITSWADIRALVRELKKPEVKEKFSTLIIDTVDLAASYCEKYVCSQHDADSIAQVGSYGQGWNILKKEFEEPFRTMTQMGYAVMFISHEKEGTFKRPDGSEYSIIRPSVTTTYNSIIENMVDIYARMYTKIEDGVSKVKLKLRSNDGSVICGGRFKHLPEEIDGTYEALVQALNTAIDKEAEEKGSKYVTNERESAAIKTEYNYDELKEDINKTITALTEKHEKADFEENIAPRITQIVERYLGKGKKLSQATRDQVEQLSLISLELKEIE
jgi:hypothetical protein